MTDTHPEPRPYGVYDLTTWNLLRRSTFPSSFNCTDQPHYLTPKEYQQKSNAFPYPHQKVHLVVIRIARLTDENLPFHRALTLAVSGFYVNFVDTFS
jgi:hypothetical protein